MNNYIPTLLAALLMLVFSGCQPGKDHAASTFPELVSPIYSASDKPFYHGVASGDPLTDRVLIWTRVTPDDSTASVEVVWEVSTESSFKDLVTKGEVSTSRERDFTVKVDVSNLQPGSTYYYRFKALGVQSPVGRTKTLPEGTPDSLRFAVVSCSNWQHGYFNAYDRIAEKDVDVVLHLGDYIYEYGTSAARKNVDRRHLPEHEILSLSDYRTRYSQYHMDAGLRKMRQNHALITIWDDHEVANNTYTEGAQNHQPEEGDFQARKAAARQAYYEWIPIREGGKHYRSFSFGNLADLMMLDERLEGKTRPAEGVTDPAYPAEERSMLGEEQLAWLQSKLASGNATWKVLGNQVLFSDLDRSAVTPKSPRNMDSWDGYPAEKQRVADFIREKSVKNIVILTGDTHSSWAFEVLANPLKKVSKERNRPLAVEFGTPSVSSANSNESLPDDTVKMREELYKKTNGHLKFVNQRDHGYVILTLSPRQAKAEWFYVNSILEPNTSETLAKTFYVDVDKSVLR